MAILAMLENYRRRQTHQLMHKLAAHGIKRPEKIQRLTQREERYASVLFVAADP